MGVASVLGVSIRNAQLHEARERQFRLILQVLAASIDARDPRQTPLSRADAAS